MSHLAIVRALTALSVCAAACAGPRDEAARYYAKEKYAPRPVDKVEVLKKTPERPHEVIADFQARGVSVKTMQKKAAKIGAHAIIVSYLGGYRSTKDEWAGEDSYSGTYTRITATAIRYTGPAKRSRESGK